MSSTAANDKAAGHGVRVVTGRAREHFGQGTKASRFSERAERHIYELSRLSITLRPVGTVPSINHVAIAVPKIEAAVAWYGAAFDFKVLAGPDLIEARSERTGEICRDLFGPRWQAVRMAQLEAGDGGGIELVEWVTPRVGLSTATTDWWQRPGLGHVAFTEPDLAYRIKRSVDTGGSQKSKVWTLFDGCDLVYCADPWGTVLELQTRSYRRTWADRADTDPPR